jgi:uncharacterized membrane protein
MASDEKQTLFSPFRGAILRGLGVVLPPLLTIVIFLWIGGTLQQYMLEPVTSLAERVLVAVWIQPDVRPPEAFPQDQRARETPVLEGVTYQRLSGGSYVPKGYYDVVRDNWSEGSLPATGAAFYRAYVRVRYLQPQWVIPLVLALFVTLLYLLGKFMAAGIGRFFWTLFEGMIRRVPLVRNVYASVKQVSGFILNERDMRVSRVVMVEYPRKGIFQIGFVTGEGMPEVEAKAGEPCLTVLVCTSPMPMAGFTINVRRSEVIDLNISLDQAIQYIVSCGVVVPRPKELVVPAAKTRPIPLVAADTASAPADPRCPQP